MNKLGERIRDLREQAGISKAALARRVGVSDVTISYWESGAIQRVGHSRLGPLSKALGCSVGYLLGDSRMSVSETKAVYDASTNHVPIYQLTQNPECLGGKTAAQTMIPTGLLPDHWKAIKGFLLCTEPDQSFDFFGHGEWLFVVPALRFTESGLYVVEEQRQLKIRRLLLDDGQCDAEDSQGRRESLAVHCLPRARVMGSMTPMSL
ncbi:helix-turn-helix domain-containing protein [Larsenimonas suaedae]|uniref:Helix-turn-helix domain-containing protein n=1 Tax=Larsenimonas suaedae TaxID=1851019 RepID=A0ABU1GUI5_9GAMM|nr:helix-turn-helix domain-containing protein [Larsenimonas suaedae]MCM2971695.1 helix-turn-helix domain-containing protein [Larsenimonas suaedae]MDR5895247.1 helix-turn-helix domain-containing protein [Larsenimonas suaedae]